MESDRRGGGYIPIFCMLGHILDIVSIHSSLICTQEVKLMEWILGMRKEARVEEERRPWLRRCWRIFMYSSSGRVISLNKSKRDTIYI